MVPEQAGQDEAGLRGTEKGPGNVGGAQRAQDIPGDGPKHGYTQEETPAGGSGGGDGIVRCRRFALRPGQVRRIKRMTFKAFPTARTL